jgi:hypothetical protein
VGSHGQCLLDRGVCNAVRVSHVRRLHASDRIFFVTVNLHRQVDPFTSPEYPSGSKRRKGHDGGSGSCSAAVC